MDRTSLGRAPEGGNGVLWDIMRWNGCARSVRKTALSWHVMAVWSCCVLVRTIGPLSVLVCFQWSAQNGRTLILIKDLQNDENTQAKTFASFLCLFLCWPSLARFFAKKSQLSMDVCLAKPIFGCCNQRFWTLEQHLAKCFSDRPSPLCAFSFFHYFHPLPISNLPKPM